MAQRNNVRLVILLPHALKKEYQKQQNLRNRDANEYVSLADIVREALEDYRNGNRWQKDSQHE